MLDGRNDYTIALAIALTSALGKTEQRQLVGFGAAVGQYNLGRADARAKAAGDLATCNLQTRGSLAAERMQRVGLTPASSLSSYSRCARSASARMGVEAA